LSVGFPSKRRNVCRKILTSSQAYFIYSMLLIDDVYTCVTDGSCNASSSQKPQFGETLMLAARSPDERRAWVQLLRQVLYADAGGGNICV